jgi:hypothetical protein
MCTSAEEEEGEGRGSFRACFLVLIKHVGEGNRVGCGSALRHAPLRTHAARRLHRVQLRRGLLPPSRHEEGVDTCHFSGGGGMRSPEGRWEDGDVCGYDGRGR